MTGETLSDAIERTAKRKFNEEHADIPEHRRAIFYPIYLAGFRAAALHVVKGVAGSVWEDPNG